MRCLIIDVTLIAGLLHALPAAAHEFSPLLRAKKFDEAARAISTRLAQAPDNADALIAQAELAIIRQTAPEDAVATARQCVKLHPKLSDCHRILGDALGSKALSGNMLSALTYAGDIRDELKTAIELDPRNLAARGSLLQYYLKAPGVVGGSREKAVALVEETAKMDGEAGIVMRAILDLNEEQISKAEAALLAQGKPAGDWAADTQLNLLSGIGFRYGDEKKYPDGERLFADVRKRFPDSGIGYFGSGWLLYEQGMTAEALPWFEHTLSRERNAYGLYYLGLCQQALGRRTQASSLFSQALGVKPGLGKRQKEDAEKRMKALASA